MLDSARTGGGGYDVVRRMGGLEGSGEVLGTEKREVIVDGKKFCFCVKMGDRGHLHAAGRYAESFILKDLKFVDGSGRSVGEPDWGSVCYEGTDEGFEGCDDSFLLLAPVGTS